MYDYENYIFDFYENQVSNMSINDIFLLKDMGLRENELAQELKIPKSYINELIYEHRKDF
ncbi:hypothetical protein Curi_c17320 [Gottschalkia acidurici 9a]|uniref:Uncharacterized protein n=1 Tax=Gottschalkia acidurici (strain ATCC 7906 / DSM 604 / BCRC 14475 / CIP 104303 / KCTC 5404 / NCIMB 10678 / 9a) TaxID=1128398 RepID=K0AZN7_GOTA9|nr:hypothetical protein [Gottschalkia acidurici]AFS78739.1 hypothetical protein Curi_c17320 [Gottschalkia acidurici 9a]